MTPEVFLQRATSTFFLLVPAAIGWKILTRQIDFAGLLYERDSTGRLVYSPARVQLLLVSVVGAGQFLWQFMGNQSRLQTSSQLILGLGSSHLYYLINQGRGLYQATKKLSTN